MHRLVLLLVVAAFLVACRDTAPPPTSPMEAPDASPGAGGGHVPSTAGPDASPTAPSDTAARASSATTSTATWRSVYQCGARGLRPINPCPAGVPADVQWEITQSETVEFCCANGPAREDVGQGCLSALEAARSCKDAEGERAVLARMEQMARELGQHPCVSEVHGGIDTYRAICRELGFK